MEHTGNSSRSKASPYRAHSGGSPDTEGKSARVLVSIASARCAPSRIARKKSMAESDQSAALTWRKSSASGVNGGACVEVAFDGEFVLVRDSQNRASPPLKVSVSAWRTLVSGIKA